MSVATTTTEQRVEQLSQISARRLIDPDVALPGNVGDGQILPDELLSVFGLELDLTAAQRAQLSREETASIVQAGVRFEAVLTAGFGLVIARARDLRAPSITYLFHEIGEETRHSRLFIRLLDQLAPQAENPFEKGLLGFLSDRGVALIIGFPALLHVLVLAGEEIPDLLQQLAAEHPDTDPYLRQINRYHRQEEARHLTFARAMLPIVWQRASAIDQFAVRYIAPPAIWAMFDMLIHPGVYATLNLPGWATWWAVRRSPSRINLRQRATKPVLDALISAGAVTKDRIPWPWRILCGTHNNGDDRAGMHPTITIQ